MLVYFKNCNKILNLTRTLHKNYIMLVINFTNIRTVEDYSVIIVISKLIFVYTLVINLTNVRTVENYLIIIVISKLIFAYTLVINLTNFRTMEKDLVTIVISKLIFAYTLVINLTNVRTVENYLVIIVISKQYCGKGFNQSSHLHVCIHICDKPYQCQYCKDLVKYILQNWYYILLS